MRAGTQLTPFNESSISSFLAAKRKPEVPFVVEIFGSKLPSLTANFSPLIMASAIAWYLSAGRVTSSMRIHRDMIKSICNTREGLFSGIILCWILMHLIRLEERILVGVFDFQHGYPRAKSGQSVGSGSPAL